MLYTRRDIGKLALASVALPKIFEAGLLAKSKWGGVQIGAITYSYRAIPDPFAILKAMKDMGLSEVELMSGDAEKMVGIPALPTFGRGGAPRAGGPPPAPPAAPPVPGAPPAAGAGAPPDGPRRGGFGRGPQLTPEQQAQMDEARAAQRKWRLAATPATFKPVVKAWKDAGIDLRLLTYNMTNTEGPNRMPDDEIEYGFMMAKALGVKAITTSTQVSMAKRLAPFANRHKIPVGFHGHDQTANPDEVSTEATFEAVMAESPYIWANLDIGHYTAANGDAVAFINKHHARITNLHLKDRKKDHGPNMPFGQGETPIKEVLRLLKKTKWDIPANIEFEYQGDPLVEIPKCIEYCKQALA